MPDWDVKYGIPMKDYRVENARDILSAGLVFQRNLPMGARPGRTVQFVSQAGHNAWFPWPGLIGHDDRCFNVLVTYEHGDKLFTHKVAIRAVSEEDARAILGQGIKTIKRIEFVERGGRNLSEEDEEALEDFIDRWNGDT